MDYWIETISAALNEVGLVATDDQIESIAGDVEVAYDQYGMAHGLSVGSRMDKSEKDLEIDRLKRELDEEKQKEVCHNCGGHGCYWCNNTGKVLPWKQREAVIGFPLARR